LAGTVSLTSALALPSAFALACAFALARTLALTLSFTPASAVPRAGVLAIASRILPGSTPVFVRGFAVSVGSGTPVLRIVLPVPTLAIVNVVEVVLAMDVDVVSTPAATAAGTAPV